MYTADAKPTHTDQVFSEAPTITLALPGWVSLPQLCVLPSSILHTVLASFYGTGSLLLSRVDLSQFPAWYSL